MAYAALRSLDHTIEGIDEYSPPETLRSALHHAQTLQIILGACCQGVGDMDVPRIMEAAIKLEDAIEFSLLSQPPTFSFNLDHDIRCFVETAKETEQIIQGLKEQKAAKMIQEDIEEEEDVEMVGLCDQFLQIRDYLLTGHESRFYRDRVIWISGMAGVGKTALAKKLFQDPSVKAYFQSRAFVRMGLKARVGPKSKEMILEDVMDQLNLDNGGLMTQKSLLILDDVWWGDLVDHLVNKEEGIVVLVTSRAVANYPLKFRMKMRFMDEEESWELLRRKVFGEKQECPPQLVKPGKKIAEKCEGLPLLINAVAPILLSQAHKDPECWNRVAHKPDSVLEEASHQISQVLLKSYNQISENDKLCFLYIASFPLSWVVPCSTILNLWLAEGFKGFYWTYMGFIEKNIAIDCQKVGVKLKLSDSIVAIDDLDGNIKSHRRLAIQENVLLAIKEVHNKIACITNVRSLLCNGPYNQYEVPICWEWKLLRVLRVLTIRFYEFPVEVVDLIRLKYVALTCNANLPPSISKLCNLEFLIVHQHLNVKRVAALSYLPLEIWYLEKVNHFEITGRNLPEPPPGVVLPHLKRLVDVGVESCTKEVLESLPMLRELRVQIELAPHATQTSSFFDHIPSLTYLESFQCVIVNSTLPSPFPPLSNFGDHLKKLSLSGFGYPWEDMSKIAKIWWLTNLKLECYAFRGEKWEAKEMIFHRLEYLLIEDTDLVQWTSGDEAFAWLKKLTMKNCHKLREIPLGYMPGVKHVELVDCNPLAETCIKKCYDDCRVKYSWKEKVKSS